MYTHRHPDHRCPPIPVVFGLGYLHTESNLSLYHNVFGALSDNRLEVYPEGWQGTTDPEDLARRMGEQALTLMGQSPLDQPVVLGGFSGGAYAAFRAYDWLQKRGLTSRVLGIVGLSISPWFDEVFEEFVEKYANKDKDWLDKRIGERANLTGLPEPTNVEVPVMAYIGQFEGEFMFDQAGLLSLLLPKMKLNVSPGAEHPIWYPQHAAAVGSTLPDLFMLAARPGYFDVSQATWHKQYGVPGVRYAYTDSGGVAVLDNGDEQPRFLDLASFACFMSRIYHGNTAAVPACDDNELAFRYHRCPALSVRPIDPAVEACLSKSPQAECLNYI